MKILVADLEGVFLPEIWISVAEKTGIGELKLTTRDISDYDVLMNRRISILKENNLKIQDIREVISTLSPLDGAMDMLGWINQRTQIIILSDTFEEFVRPLRPALGFPSIFCHNLEIDEKGNITGYRIRVADQKARTVNALRKLNFKVIAFGDSYNDISMIQAAHTGFLFRPPSSVVEEFPDFPVAGNYDDMKTLLDDMLS